MSEPPSKRCKPDPVTAIAEAWECYREYIDAEPDSEDDISENDSENNNDVENGVIDMLLELIECLGALDVQPFDMPLTLDTMKDINIHALLPILLSMSYVHLANYATSYVLNHPQADGTQPEILLGFDSPTEYFERALMYWPTNPAGISLYANFDRIHCCCRSEKICERYVKASECASKWREMTVNFLEDTKDVVSEVEGMNVKEWVELLIANGALGMDCIDDADDDDEEEVSGDGYSFSEIEATASFMSALLLSLLGKHNEAIVHLKKFNLSHRIHPNVWKFAQSPPKAQLSNANAKDEDEVLFSPRLYTVEGRSIERKDDHYPSGILSPALYNRVCKLFGPKASYWTESDYSNRGYYSYFIDLDDISNGKSVRERPTNLIEDIIVSHLLPLAEKALQECQQSANDKTVGKIVGAEWWCHTRQLGANLGHQIHFDTDESLLGREKIITHPIVSSVLYLSGAKQGDAETGKAGATIVFNQTPDSKETASKAWISHPQDNSFMTFPGNLLHGVLPCTGSRELKDATQYTKPENNRLTLMVGFWTRNVAEGMEKHRELYGPCGPLPPATDKHSWVIECQKGYRQTDASAERSEQVDVTHNVLSCISPAWEEFKSSATTRKGSDPPVLVVPKGLDHRYFVLNAPFCFTDSLHENDDCF